MKRQTLQIEWCWTCEALVDVTLRKKFYWCDNCNDALYHENGWEVMNQEEAK